MRNCWCIIKTDSQCSKLLICSNWKEEIKIMLLYFSFGLKMFYNVNLFNELLNFYSSGSKFLKDYLNKFWQLFLKARVFQKLFIVPLNIINMHAHLFRQYNTLFDIHSRWVIVRYLSTSNRRVTSIFWIEIVKSLETLANIWLPDCLYSD